MLEAKVDVRTESKVGSQTTKSPDDLAGGTVDLVHGTGIASRDQVVAFGILVHGVDMEVVPCVGGVVACTRLSRVKRKNSLYVIVV
jgi:hypothetical protein